ncbi:MAG TPA: 2OG-Fe(II) oxygenase [Caulobacteraceae bacterium]|jgi:hypothetical protein
MSVERTAEAAELTETGKRLLTGPPEGHGQAIATLDAAAHAGSGEAAALVGVLAGLGALTEQSWPRALEYTAHAAALGWAPARGVLQVLSGDEALKARAAERGAPATAWVELARSVDLRGWLTPPPKRPLCEAPRIRAADGFLPGAACEWLVERARGSLSPAQVYGMQEAGPTQVRDRTNSAMEFGLLSADLVLLLVQARISALTGLPTQAFEPTQVLHYAPGQEFRSHVDFLQGDKPGMAEEVACKGQRIATFIIYLNDDFEGGETEFQRVGIRFKGKAGDGLFWANVDAAGQPDRMTLHAGLPPLSGEKWLLSQWIRDRAPMPPA